MESVYVLVFEDNQLEMADSVCFTNKEHAEKVCENYQFFYKERIVMVKTLRPSKY